MTGRVDGKMSFVTGAAQGLGEAIAYMLAKEGSKVVLADINEEKLTGVEDRINSDFPGKAHSVKLDVTSEDQWKDTLNEAEKLMGGINILVNNAGIGGGSTVEETDCEIFKQVMAVDTDSVFLGCKYAIPIMKNYSPGSIINTSSISGLIAGHNMAAYNTAKAGVWMLTKSVALHCARSAYNIRCNSVTPGSIATERQIKHWLTPKYKKFILDKQCLKRQLKPDDVASLVVHLSSDVSSGCTKQNFIIDAGIT